MAMVQSGQEAPRFTLLDTGGKPLALAEALAKGPVVAAFFKISCPTCQFTFPFLERLHRAFGDRAAFIGVSQDDAGITEEFRLEYGITFPCVVDEDNYPVSREYGLTYVPTTYLLSPDGKVSLLSVGFVKDDLLRISTELAVSLHKPEPLLFGPEEIIPDYKPG